MAKWPQLATAEAWARIRAKRPLHKVRRLISDLAFGRLMIYVLANAGVDRG
jgi:hypothetical protein